MGVIAGLDFDGRIAAFAIVMQNAGLAAGPAVAGLLITGDGYGMLGWMGIGPYGPAMVFILPLALSLGKADREGDNTQ
jgi:predicted MFS family arabinose efflux permease